jgi:hypothetical protein
MTPDGEDDDLVEIAELPLPPLKSVFDCPNLELCIVNEWMEKKFHLLTTIWRQGK